MTFLTIDLFLFLRFNIGPSGIPTENILPRVLLGQASLGPTCLGLGLKQKFGLFNIILAKPKGQASPTAQGSGACFQ